MIVRLEFRGQPAASIALTIRGRTLAIEALAPRDPLIFQRLSDRQREVASLVAEGLGNREVALRLGLSESTVASHLIHIYRKLELAGRFELVRRIFESRDSA